MPQRILGIDVGSWSAKVVLLESSFRGFKVEAVHERPVAWRHGDDTAAKHAKQREALAGILGEEHLRADITVLAFPGERATTRFVTLPFTDAKKIDATIAGEVEDVVPFDLDAAVLSHERVETTGDYSLSLCAVAMREQVSDQLDLVKGQPFDPRNMPVDVLALYNLYTHFLAEDASKAEIPSPPATDAAKEHEPSGVEPIDARLVVDIGHERTLVCAASPAGIAHVRVIRAGGADVTAAIAKHYGLEWQQAEDGKHEDAFVASLRHPAPSDAAQRMSDAVARGLEVLVRELRRTLRAIKSERRVRIARIDLVGGGSRVRNLAQYLAEQLDVPVATGVAVEQVVERQVDVSRRAAHACALACALRAVAEKSVSEIDLRVGEFAYAGQMRHLRRRIPIIAAALVALLLLTGAQTFARYQTLNRREQAIDEQFCAITEKTVGRRICEPTIALSVMKDPPSDLGNFKLPERSAYRVASLLSQLVPKKVDVTISDLEITPQRAMLKGQTGSFDDVDEMVAAYGMDRCISEITKPTLRQKPDGKGVEFQLSMRLECKK